MLCSGTHPFSRWQDQTVSPNPRYAKLVHEMQWMAKRLQIFGVHVHVGVRSPEKAVAIASALAGYIPHLLALSASSPYWEGEDTGLASCRSKVFEGLPTAGLPGPDRELGRTSSGSWARSCPPSAISTIREVWWDIRPHPDFGTVELRMCDGMPTMSRGVRGRRDGPEPRRAGSTRSSTAATRCRATRTGCCARTSGGPAATAWTAELIIDEDGRVQPLRASVEDLLAELAPVADAARLRPTSWPASTASSGAAPSYSRQRTAAAAAEHARRPARRWSTSSCGSCAPTSRERSA